MLCMERDVEKFSRILFGGKHSFSYDISHASIECITLDITIEMWNESEIDWSDKAIDNFLLI